MRAIAQAAFALVHGGAAALSLATGSLVAAVWQGILLAVLVGLGLRLLPKTPAAVRFAIWFGVFVIVAALPVALLWPRAAGTVAAGAHAWITVDERWCAAIAAVWVVASVTRAVTLAAAGFRVRALWKRATPVEFVNSPQGLRSLSRQDNYGTAEAVPFREERGQRADLGYGNDSAIADTTSRRAQLCVSDEVDRPTVIGFFAPKILIPSWLMEKLTPAELEQVVLHEREHLGRADDWLNLLQKIALVVFPLNPALAWVERRLCLERELAVDERVLEAVAGRAGAAKAYARCLTTLAEYRLERNALRRGLALVLGVLGRESELGRRVGRILEPRGAMRPAHARLVLGGAALGLLIAATTLERCPQVVGFAAPTSEQAAVQGIGIREQAGAIGTVAAPAMGGFRAEPVVARMDAPGGRAWRAIDSVNIPRISGVQAHVKVTHEDRSDANRAAARESAAAGFEAVNVAQPLPAEASDTTMPAVKANAAQAESHVAKAQWRVVVTSWRADGGRIEMTTEEFSNAAPIRMPAGQASPQAQDQAGPGSPGNAGVPEQQMRQRLLPYEVVPVRGGWLVIQL